eukprot:TRINITY_DN2538_c0_g2_i1.p1 TRINITY_DN2538_c0_g2~~TRINITY_DN2538_c0_g2_i1.p1  ORF type:complete len:461 (-),score=72.20 TRINITY_DN2538_c0_g2_i1:72-1454(-)
MSTCPESEKRLALQKIAGEADLRLVEVLLDIAESCSKRSFEMTASAEDAEKEVPEESSVSRSVDTRLDLARAFAQQLVESLHGFDALGRSALAVEKRDLSIMTTLDGKDAILESKTLPHDRKDTFAMISEDVVRSAANIAADMAAVAVSLFRHGKHDEYNKMNKMREELHKHASDVFNEKGKTSSLGAQTDECMRTDGKPLCVRIQNAVTGALVAELDTNTGSSGTNLRFRLAENLKDSELLRAQFLYDSKVLPLGAPLWMALLDHEIPDVLDLQMTIHSSGSFEKVPSQEYDALLKVLLVGNAGVGKTCLMNRFVDDTYSASYVSTIGVDFRLDMRRSSDGRVVKVQVWDTAGQERFRAITSSYYRGCHGCLFVFDLTDRESFDALDKWYREVSEGTGPSPVGFTLAGTKADLEAERQVSKDEAQAWARSHGMHYVETSSKQGSSVDSAFDELVSRCLH